MNLPQVVAREQWLVARRELLEQEKRLTRTRDALNADRRRLPMVRVDKEYSFQGPRGPVGLADLFEGSRQLIVQHVMFAPDWDAACPGCTAGLDETPPALLRHLRARDTAFAAVSRAPLPKLQAYAIAKGWTFPWYSSQGSDFNYDFHVTLDSSVAPIMFNYREPAELEQAGLGWATRDPGEQPGLSVFLRDGDAIFHTYSTYARGTEVGGAYGLLDLTALGRQEEWEEPKDRVANPRKAMPDFS